MATYTPPAGEDITPYLVRLVSIIEQLNSTKNKAIALERIQLLMDDITAVITAANK